MPTFEEWWEEEQNLLEGWHPPKDYAKAGWRAVLAHHMILTPLAKKDMDRQVEENCRLRSANAELVEALKGARLLIDPFVHEVDWLDAALAKHEVKP